MTDLVAGRYPTAEEEWLLDGAPYPPFRRTLSRRDITSTFVATAATLFVFAVPVQAGDIFNFVQLPVKVATSAGTHSWVAVYNGTGATATLLAQSTDVTGGFPLGNVKLQLNSAVANIGTVGTPQGPGTGAIVADGPTVYGVAVYNSGTTGATLDGMAGGALNGEVLATGQVPISSSVALAATATAPSTLAGIAAISGAVPYLLLTRQ